MLELTGLNKLEGFGPVYVINMEKSLDRKNYIDEHFKKYGISDYTFIKAVDGSVEDLSNLIENHNSLPITKGEAACSLSHLKAIEQWLNESDSECAIFVEDDSSFETVDFWSFTWKDFLESIDYDYDILQLAIINNFTVNPRLHLREFLDWSAAVYLIKRPYAKKLIEKHKKENKYVLGTVRHLAVSEGMLFGTSLCYSIPLFTYSIDLGSSLNESHVQTVHKSSRDQTMKYWQNNDMFKPDIF
jgi:GR25 family glycosyltransferase involved in LPS biosynthesis